VAPVITYFTETSIMAIVKEGNLEAPTRHPLDWKNPEFYNEEALYSEPGIHWIGRTLNSTMKKHCIQSWSGYMTSVMAAAAASVCARPSLPCLTW